MASRQQQQRTQFLVGIFVVAMGLVMLASLFVIAVTDGLLRQKSTIISDFGTVSGLKENSVVQLAGKEIGVVRGIDFVSRQYECKPETEDIGRNRTDDCHADLFCADSANGGLCAVLEEYTGVPEDYEACTGTCDAPDHVCVTQPFRKRYRSVRWRGRDGICVPLRTSHQRVEVRMEVFDDAMPFIRTDSRATISSNGVLGDQLVDITVGTGEAVPDGGHIQSNLSLMEELMTFKDRFDSITDNINRSLEGVAEFGEALNSDQTKRAVQGFIANAETISKQIADGEGVVGGLISDPEYKEEFSQTLTSVRQTSKSLESTMAEIDRQIDPALASLRTAATSLGELSDLAKDPNNPALVSRLFNDGKLADDVATAVADASGAIESTKATLEEVQGLVAEVSRAITAGEGTLGKLIKDPKAYDDLVKALGNIERNQVLKKLVRFLYESDEAADGGRPVAPATADRD